MLCKPILSQTDQSDSLPCALRGRGGLIIYLQLLVSDFDSVHMENCGGGEVEGETYLGNVKVAASITIFGEQRNHHASSKMHSILLVFKP